MHRSCVLSTTLARVKAEMESQAKAIASKRKAKNAKGGKETPALEVEWVDKGYGALISEGSVGQGGHYWAVDVHCLGCGGVMK